MRRKLSFQRHQRRLIENRPRQGFLAVPGGFVDFNESAEEAVVRECREEIGVTVQGARFLCSAPNIYEYKGIVYRTCDLFFTAELPSEYDSIDAFIKSLKAEESEVVAFESHCIATAQDVEALPLAFESARVTLTRWLSAREAGVPKLHK